jgi:hypothetical protein
MSTVAVATNESSSADQVSAMEPLGPLDRISLDRVEVGGIRFRDAERRNTPFLPQSAVPCNGARSYRRKKSRVKQMGGSTLREKLSPPLPPGLAPRSPRASGAGRAGARSLTGPPGERGGEGLPGGIAILSECNRLMTRADIWLHLPNETHRSLRSLLGQSCEIFVDTL